MQPHRVDRRQVRVDELPALAGVVAGPQRAGGRAHRKLRAVASTSRPCGRPDRRRRAAAGPRATSQSCRRRGARHRKRAVARHADLVLDRRARTRRSSGPSDARRPRSRNRRPATSCCVQVAPASVGAEDAAVMLHPHRVGRGRAARDAMRVLHFRACRPARAACRPRSCPCRAASSSRRRRCVSHTPPQEIATNTRSGVARIGRDRMDAGVVIAAAEPLRALRHVPQRAR